MAPGVFSDASQVNTDMSNVASAVDMPLYYKAEVKTGAKDITLPVNDINVAMDAVAIDRGVKNDQDSALIEMPDFNAQLQAFKAVTRFLPTGNEDETYWWTLIGRHVARMMHEADYPIARQVQLLLFHRFRIIPFLGPRPRSHVPWFKSRVAPGAGDGTPIGYSWKWGVGNGKPTIRHYMEPLGRLTGTSADPLNETAPKEMLLGLADDFPRTELSALWTYATHLRPHALDEATRQKYFGSALLLGLEMPAESDNVDVMAGLITKVPSQVCELLPRIIPQAMRDAFGADVCLRSLEVAQDVIDNDPHLSVNGTMALDCVRGDKSRFKFYTMNTGTSFDHIVHVMTLGGRKMVPQTVLDQLRELWYGLKAVNLDFPTSSEVPVTTINNAQNVGAMAGNASGLSFYFDLHPERSLPDVKMQVDLSKHADNDLAAALVVTGFLQRHGQAHYAKAYLNMLQGMVPIEELRSRRGVLAYFSFAIKKSEIEIKSYFNPQAYRRYTDNQFDLGGGSPRRQRRSLFD